MNTLNEETGIVCAYLARTASEKALTTIEPRLSPPYALKLHSNQLTFQNVLG